MPEPVRVSFLFSRACPSNDEGLALLRRAGAVAGLALQVEEHEVASDAEAERLRFAGSPTYLVEGADLLPGEPGALFRYDACRAYARPDGRIAPLPALEDLASALRAAARSAA